MSDESDGEGGNRGFWRVIREAKEEAFQARRSLRRELPSPTLQTKRAVAEALSDYRDVLWDYHNENALETAWDERPVNVDELDQYLSQTITTREPMNRRGKAAEQVQVPLVAQVSAQKLLAIGKELDAIAKELGFAAEPKEQMVKAQDVPQKLPDHIKQEAPAYQPRADGGEQQ